MCFLAHRASTGLVGDAVSAQYTEVHTHLLDATGDVSHEKYYIR